MTMWGTILLFVLTLVTFLWWRSRPRNSPPSPGLALPLVGHLYFFRGNPVDQFNTWRERLGNIFSIQMGPFRSVMVNGYDLISETCLKHHESLLYRQDDFIHNTVYDNVGLASLGGQQWKEQRAFLQSRLRSLGMGQNIMADRIKVEADYLVETLKKTEGKATDLSNLVKVCVTNVICGVVFSKRFMQKDEKIIRWLHFLREFSQLLGGTAGVLYFFPVLKNIPGDFFKYKELKSTVQEMRHMVWEWVEKEKRVVNVSDEAFEDLVQAYLTEIERKRLQGVIDTTMDEANLLSTTLGLFYAGTETSASTILFAVLYMTCFPEVQAKVFQEIKGTVGTERAPDLSDKTKLKFTSAFIAETQRFSNILPLAIDRLATSDIHLAGYTITKGTTLIVNIDSVLKDKEVWGDPEVFRPDRFLDENGSVVIKKEFLPYGLGKRNCFGEGLAVMELFIFISTLVQKFEFVPEIKDQMPSLTPDTGITRSPKPFKVRAISRRQ